MTIGDSFTAEREDYLDGKYFEIRKVWDSVGMNQEEKLWMVLNFLYDPIVRSHYDSKSRQTDTTLAHMELDKIIEDMTETIDTSNDRLYINKEKV